MNIKGLIKKIFKELKVFDDFFSLQKNKIPVNFHQYLKFLFTRNKRYYWPIHPSSKVTGNVYVGINSSVGASPGCYIQGIGKVMIGNYCLLGPNVGIISANHDLFDYRKHVSKEVIINDYCWIGMNSVILPGVELGEHTIVAANSVVKDSFTKGHCILAGNPAKIIKELSPENFIRYKDGVEMYGYIPKAEFKGFCEKYDIDQNNIEFRS